jgi:hypothetical protein
MTRRLVFGYLVTLSNVRIMVSIQPPANLTGTFRGVVCLQVTSETWEYGKCRSSFVQPE